MPGQIRPHQNPRHINRNRLRRTHFHKEPACQLLERRCWYYLYRNHRSSSAAFQG
jgi:hypothetical protein